MSAAPPRLLLIANPASRRMRNQQHLAIARILARRYDVETVLSTGAEHVRELAAGAASRGFSVLGAMGGDGLVSNAASGLAGTDVCLAILPAGTANASARSLGIPADASRAAEALVLAPTRRPVPVARITLSSSRGEQTRYALSQIGVGLDAEVVRHVEAHTGRKRRLGELYFAAVAICVLSRLRRDPPPPLRVASESRRADAVSLVIQVRWPYTYLGPLPIALTPEPVAGLDVLVIQAFTTRAIFSAVTRTFTVHSFGGCPGVQMWTRCHELEIAADGAPMVVQADGEPVGSVSSMRVAWTSEALVVANPCSSARRRW